ncbi:MAG TPA: winged helix DNA-binding domain-containing protein [Thermoleophilaceae bacterium]|nr:winged helix DNA-binding domain-containing protein [Thermoleophilaceae bacterium]
MIAERLTAQLLAGPPARDPVAVAERLLAIQGQDLRGARLAVRARTSGLAVSDVDRALADRSLLITWVNRGTLHLIRAADYPWLHALTAPTLLTSNARRLEQEGVSPAAAERGVAAIERALAENGPQTRDQLREHVASAAGATAGQALLHVLLLASLRGLTVRGPMVGKQQAHVLVTDWLGEPPPVDRDRALAQLARRYLAGHGPASDRDLARWAGLPLRDARAGLETIAPQLTQRDDGLVDLAKRPQAAAELPPPRLLGPFEPLLLGWTSREPILGDNVSVVTVNGIFKAIALVGGRAVATWTMPKGRVELAPFGRLRAADREALEADAADLARFLAS